MLRVAPVVKQSKTGLPGNLEAVVEAMKGVPWTVLQELKGDPDVLKKIDEAEALLQSLRKALS
jgi:ParB family chromosome partitioning protein